MIYLIGALAAFAGCCFCVFFGAYRNQKVYRLRMKMLDKIQPGDPDFSERMKELMSVPYNSMVLSFRPLRSFYKGTEILKRIEE